MSWKARRESIMTAMSGKARRKYTHLLIFVFHSPDVVVDRARYIQEYKEYYTEAVKVDPTTHEIIDRDKRYILVSQDEKIHHRYCIKTEFLVKNGYFAVTMFKIDTGTMEILTFHPTSPRAGL
jgi:ribosomal protein L15E